MLKLILHHTYKLDGEAVDLSRHQNHGFCSGTSYQPDGRSPGSGALQFANDYSQVHVPRKPVWNNPLALRIEIWVRVAELGRPQVLVAGHNAFTFMIREDGVLFGTIGRPGIIGFNVNSELDSPDGVRRTVPLDTWTRLTYHHDGLTTVRLFIDDTLVGLSAGPYLLRDGVRTPVLDSVPSVAPGGITIGHDPVDHLRTFRGEIDELKIWKYDPQSPSRQFFCRPTNPDQRQCRDKYETKLKELLDDGEQRKSFVGLKRCAAEAMTDMIRDIRSRGATILQEQEEHTKRYMELWCRGDIAGKGMARFMGDWLAWLDQVLSTDGLNDYLKRFKACAEQFQDFDLAGLGKILVTCDPELAAYIHMMGEIMAKSRPHMGWQAQQGPKQDFGPTGD